MVLVTGPTGSGKTTTLYSPCANQHARGEHHHGRGPRRVQPAGRQPGAGEAQIGLTFAGALRSFLRQDPDIILVGEIRDTETAEIAIKAALTGHLVLSTLHTNDAPSSITPDNMGIEPFLVTTSVHMVAAQRLVRRICDNCKKETEVPPPALVNLGFGEDEAERMVLYKGGGCERCSHTGYKGRVALYEVMAVGEDIRDLVLSGGSAFEIRQRALESGMIACA